MYKIIAAIIGGIFLVIGAWMGKADESTLNKTLSSVEQPTKIEVNGKIVNFGDNNTITSVETQIINKSEKK